MKSIATLATAAALFSIGAAGVTATGDESRNFGNSTVSGTIGGVPAAGYGQDDLTAAYLTF